MQDITTRNFGLLIAYILPGVTSLWGLSQVFDPIEEWLTKNAAESPTIGGFLYLTLAAVTAGIAASTVRWVVVDTIHARTGVRQPEWNLARLHRNVGAFGVFIENHYRYYQHYANMLIAISVGYACHRWSVGVGSTGVGWVDAGFVVGTTLLFFASRDALQKYYERVGAMLNEESGGVERRRNDRN